MSRFESYTLPETNSKRPGEVSLIQEHGHV